MQPTLHTLRFGARHGVLASPQAVGDENTVDHRDDAAPGISSPHVPAGAGCRVDAHAVLHTTMAASNGHASAQSPLNRAARQTSCYDSVLNAAAGTPLNTSGRWSSEPWRATNASRFHHAVDSTPGARPAPARRGRRRVVQALGDAPFIMATSRTAHQPGWPQAHRLGCS